MQMHDKKLERKTRTYCSVCLLASKLGYPIISFHLHCNGPFPD